MIVVFNVNDIIKLVEIWDCYVECYSLRSNDPPVCICFLSDYSKLSDILATNERNDNADGNERWLMLNNTNVKNISLYTC